MICYHITTRDRLESILKDGLKINSPHNRSAKDAPYIMLSKNPTWKLFNNWKKDKNKILIELDIQLSPNEIELLDTDPEGLAYEKNIEPNYFKHIYKLEILK
jgi:hypothetical protein